VVIRRIFFETQLRPDRRPLDYIEVIEEADRIESSGLSFEQLAKPIGTLPQATLEGRASLMRRVLSAREGRRVEEIAPFIDLTVSDFHDVRQRFREQGLAVCAFVNRPGFHGDCLV